MERISAKILSLMLQIRSFEVTKWTKSFWRANLKSNWILVKEELVCYVDREVSNSKTYGDDILNTD